MASSLALTQNELPFATYPGACPDVPNQPDFDVTKYTGVWYTYIANDKRNIPENANCVAATYEILTESSISVNNTAVYDIERRGYNTMLPSWAYGSAVVLNPEYPTQLTSLSKPSAAVVNSVFSVQIPITLPRTP